MSGRLRWDGLEDLKVALRTLPARLTEKATTIVVNKVEEAETSLIQAYPLGPTGNLRRRVFISRIDTGRYGAGLTLRSAAPHALLYEYGTVARKTKKGWQRGVMKPRPVFGRVMARKRREMWHDLADLMRDEGLRVTENG